MCTLRWGGFCFLLPAGRVWAESWGLVQVVMSGFVCSLLYARRSFPDVVFVCVGMSCACVGVRGLPPPLSSLFFETGLSLNLGSTEPAGLPGQQPPGTPVNPSLPPQHRDSRHQPLHLVFHVGTGVQTEVLFTDLAIFRSPKHRHFEATADGEMVGTCSSDGGWPLHVLCVLGLSLITLLPFCSALGRRLVSHDDPGTSSSSTFIIQVLDGSL